jgi:hypothetical protein
MVFDDIAQEAAPLSPPGERFYLEGQRSTDRGDASHGASHILHSFLLL